MERPKKVRKQPAPVEDPAEAKKSKKKAAKEQARLMQAQQQQMQALSVQQPPVNQPAPPAREYKTHNRIEYTQLILPEWD